MELSSSASVSNETSPLWRRWKEDGDPEAKKRIIEIYTGLVDFVTSRLAIGLPRSVAKEDLTSYGIMGLIDAVEKFDYQRGLQFETYASWRIRGSIIDGMRQADWVPRSVREKAKRIEDAYQKLEQQYLRSVTDSEISSYLNVPEQDFHHMVQEVSVTSICSLEDPIREEETETRASLLVDDRAVKPEESVRNIFVKESLAKAIEKLTDKERTVISLFYYEELSLSEIAEVMSLSPSRISQLHSKAILRLRGSLGRNKHYLMQE
ncbi:FliA/WhiG family RNA polymerase sigma factor [Paenibacillus alkalitolerans]|uniref:FliA/WhiG family RNA polymerase sigma factor n=1 Tax=Paenibacillus alkalitolerans TaxID=2799335 RepID=UPI0018F6D932|nr:FliA/WhiG family RNA polymerase sigma factor [Paenibacillus alkalitolerans]